MADQESFGAWLRREMTARGYDVDSPRGGGRTTLAAESGVSISIISRILTGERAAEVDTLRKIGRVLGYDIVQMMIHAGLIEYTELPAGESTPAAEPAAERPDDDTLTIWTAAGPVEVPSHVGKTMANMEDWMRAMWVAPGLTIPERRAAINEVILLRMAAERGEQGGHAASESA